MKLKVTCDFCGIEFQRDECYLRGKKHHFCSRQCLADFSNKKKNPNGYKALKDYTSISQNMSELNRKLNPTRMTSETREKLRRSRLGKGKCKGYSKIHGRSAHRVIAEKILGRPLRDEEVVHHRNRNRYDNSPENLIIFPNQSAHVKHHQELQWFIQELKRMEDENE